ncbi:GTPase Der [Sesamum angolense]|uniref:GTPase Der n=1 Tax=Sesamum angolense TaxID=2727404 RepID=A0AAE1XAH6_9LAMI|nr:GTPase Der [Sesamum angolense]
MSSLEICTLIPFSKNCSLLSPLPNSFPSPTAFFLSPIRRPQLHLRSPLLPPLSAANISTNTEKEDLLLGEIQEDSEHDEEELLEEEWSSDEEPERFDVQEFEREAKQVVKDFSVSLSRELRIGPFLEFLKLFLVFLFLSLIIFIANGAGRQKEDDISNQKETRGKQKRRTNTGSNIPDHLLPRVAIVGRPNVGKSALFNRLVGGNKAIVVDEPGVTRDRLYGRSYWGDYEFMVVDTGGVLTISKSQDDVMEELAISTTIGMEGIPLASREAAVARMPSMVERQATVAVEESSVIIFLVDGQAGLTAADIEIGDWLRKNYSHKSIFLAVNKCESPRKGLMQASEFWALGYSPLPISAISGSGTGELLDSVCSQLKKLEFSKVALFRVNEFAGGECSLVFVRRHYLTLTIENGEVLQDHKLCLNDALTRPDVSQSFHHLWPVRKMDLSMGCFASQFFPLKAYETENHIEEYVPAIAIVGRPNVGKSSILNALVGEDRTIVSPISGTTRDAIDTEFTGSDGQKFRLIDTAGIRKRAAVASSGSTTEALSVNRAFRAVRRSDVVALVIEAMACITEQDFKIAERIEKEGKGCLIVVNKWDTIPNKNQQTAMHYEEDVRGKLRILNWAPIVYSTAIQGQSVEKIIVAASMVEKERSRRLSTAILNQVVREAVAFKAPPRTRGGKRGRVYYCTQAAIGPPTFVFFVNDSKLFPETYRRYMEKQLRSSAGFTGTPIRLLWRSRRKVEKDEDEVPSVQAMPKFTELLGHKTQIVASVNIVHVPCLREVALTCDSAVVGGEEMMMIEVVIYGSRVPKEDGNDTASAPIAGNLAVFILHNFVFFRVNLFHFVAAQGTQ